VRPLQLWKEQQYFTAKSTADWDTIQEACAPQSVDYVRKFEADCTDPKPTAGSASLGRVALPVEAVAGPPPPLLLMLLLLEPLPAPPFGPPPLPLPPLLLPPLLGEGDQCNVFFPRRKSQHPTLLLLISLAPPVSSTNLRTARIRASLSRFLSTGLSPDVPTVSFSGSTGVGSATTRD
jgi:hypothetical protein